MNSIKALLAAIVVVSLAIVGVLLLGKNQDNPPARKIPTMEKTSSETGILSKEAKQKTKKKQKGFLEINTSKGRTAGGIDWSYEKNNVKDQTIILNNADGTTAYSSQTDPIASSQGSQIVLKAQKMTPKKAEEALQEILSDSKLKIKDRGVGKNHVWVFESEIVMSAPLQIKKKTAVVNNVYSTDMCKLLKDKKSISQSNTTLQTVCSLKKRGGKA